MKGIKLTSNGNYQYIAEPSGPRTYGKNLKIGGCYLHERGYCYRRIIQIDGNGRIYYKDSDEVPGNCKISQFVTKCPNEATPEEIAFLDKEFEKKKSANPEAYREREERNNAFYQHRALLMALWCVRNTIIENYHSEGKITDKEMMAFNKEVANKIYTFLQFFFNPCYQEQEIDFLNNPLFYFPSGWDIPTFDKSFLEMAERMKKRRLK